MITVVVTSCKMPGRVDFHMFNKDAVLMGHGDMEKADAPRNIRYWNKLGWTVRLSPARRR